MPILVFSNFVILSLNCIIAQVCPTLSHAASLHVKSKSSSSNIDNSLPSSSFKKITTYLWTALKTAICYLVMRNCGCDMRLFSFQLSKSNTSLALLLIFIRDDVSLKVSENECLKSRNHNWFSTFAKNLSNQIYLKHWFSMKWNVKTGTH